MKPAHVNTATFTGLIEETTVHSVDEKGTPLVRFTVDTRNGDYQNPDGDMSERQHCIAIDDLAARLEYEAHPGAVIRVTGPLLVNSWAMRPLEDRIAKLAVRSATIIRSAPTVHEEVCEALAAAKENRRQAYKSAGNEVHLVGKVLRVFDDIDVPRLTLVTRAKFAATHDVAVLRGLGVEGKVRVGDTAEVRGVLSQHVEFWRDGQVRLFSRVDAEHVTVLERSRARRPRPSLRLVGGTAADTLRQN